MSVPVAIPVGGEILHGEGHFGFADDVVVDAGDGLDADGVAAGAFGGGLDDDLVAGDDHAAELGVFDAEEEGLFLGLFAFGADGEDGADLGHGFEDEHAGHHRVARPVALEEGFVDRDVFDALHVFVGLPGDDPVHQQEREPVRQQLHDLVDVEDGLGLGAAQTLEGVGLAVAVAERFLDAFGEVHVHGVAGLYADDVALDRPAEQE